MDVIFYDVITPADPGPAKQVSLDEVLTQSDYISLHVPKVPATTNMLNAETFAKMKDGVYIVNCARGGVVDEDALYDALVSGKVAGAALDVFLDEKVNPGNAKLFEPQGQGRLQPGHRLAPHRRQPPSRARPASAPRWPRS